MTTTHQLFSVLEMTLGFDGFVPFHPPGLFEMPEGAPAEAFGFCSSTTPCVITVCVRSRIYFEVRLALPDEASEWKPADCAETFESVNQQPLPNGRVWRFRSTSYISDGMLCGWLAGLYRSVWLRDWWQPFKVLGLADLYDPHIAATLAAQRQVDYAGLLGVAQKIVFDREAKRAKTLARRR